MIKHFIVLINLVLVIFSLAGEEIFFRLKNGDVIKGELVTENDDFVTVKLPYGKVKLNKSIVADRNSSVNFRYINSSEQKRSNAVNTFQDNNQELINWIFERRSDKTGIFESFFPTKNPMLKNQSSTYDQAVIGIVLLKSGYLEKARQLGDFFIGKNNINGYANFYHRHSGYPGLEKISHLGPNCWLGLFFLHLYKKTLQKKYLSAAKEIIEWATRLNNFKGGYVMSNRKTGRAPWDKIVSTENNIDLYALLREYLKISVDDKDSFKYKKILENVQDFILMKMLEKDTINYKVYRGYRVKGGRDPVEALDNYSWLIGSFGASFLEKKQVSTKLLVESFIQKFSSISEGIKGFDFTDKAERLIIKRDPLVSFEWTFGAILAIREAENFYNLNNIFAQHSSLNYLQEMKKGIFSVKENFSSIQYATRGGELIFNDSYWWKTPEDGNYGNKCGSLISVSWYFLIELDVNPFFV